MSGQNNLQQYYPESSDTESDHQRQARRATRNLQGVASSRLEMEEFSKIYGADLVDPWSTAHGVSRREWDLSPREFEIVRLVSKGLQNKTIAHILDISPHTVSTHLRRIFAKLQVHNRTALAARLMEGGWGNPRSGQLNSRSA